MGWLALGLALLPALLGAANLWFQPRARGTARRGTLVSILIPARNEAAHIGDCLAAAAGSRNVDIEILVMDDASTDGTAGIVARHPQVRLLRAPALPAGWTGKVHACARLAEAARGDWLLFVDADVRLAPDAAATLAAHAAERRLALVSGVPRQRIGSWGEALTVPFINVLMLGYLPFGGRGRMRRPGFAAACGQLLMLDAASYRAVGGHGAIRAVLHDGLALARLLRARGHRTEVVDGAPLASCRMYRGFAEAWAGFAKNAHEGMATPAGLPVWTLLLAGGHLLPWALLPDPRAVAALALGFAIRAAIAARAREPLWTVALHPFSVLVALAIQWQALIRALMGRRAGWKGREYPVTTAE
ncbi:glycosyltransferase [Rhodovarius crocodyli]|uniref:Glycosyltransferase n=1 Tax=Rhodovarius crocodyli TaxID=1979269 RepID=A0A437MH76_9PROT|nr:glycosyltransferase family A protein [Rhodovarius crocodyli]RVT97008.1 glycosyltransferase [Rhodovarius crocodyli]